MSKTSKILIFDVETTGFKPKGKLVEIGIVSLCLKTGEVDELFNSMTHENGITLDEIEASWIVANSSITIEEVRNSPHIDLIRPTIQMIIDDYPLGITAYNNVFDFRFAEDAGLKLHTKLGCPMRIGSDVCCIPHKPNARGYTRKGNKWPSVEEAYEFFFPNSGYVEEHRGLDDAIHEAKIVYALFMIGHFKVPGYGS